MKVYLVWESDYEQSNVHGVYSTPEKAMASEGDKYTWKYDEERDEWQCDMEHAYDVCLTIESYILDDEEE